MDWEQVSLGGSMHDLGWWLLFDDFHSIDHGIPRLDGLGDREETLAFWEDRTGRSARDVHWYEVYAGWKVSAISMRTMTLGVTDGKLQRAVRNPFLVRTCRLLDLEPPPEYL
jgi:aminoglycoside phosphotransferase (APT) family kinase protein